MSNTPFERIWDQHVVAEYGAGRALIHIDRHFAHEGTSARAFDGLRRAGLPVRRPDLTVGTIDHGISTMAGRRPPITGNSSSCPSRSFGLVSLETSTWAIAPR